MPKYLSQEWLDEFRTLAQDQPEHPEATVKVQYRTPGGPEGDLDYYWILEKGKILEANLGTVPDADFTITMSYDDAAMVQRGDLDPNTAFMRGKMKVSGNMAKMMSLLPITSSPEWQVLQEKIRAITDY